MPAWTDCEVRAMLSTLSDNKASCQSGNGWKSTVWPAVVKAIHAANPTVGPKTVQQAKDKLKYHKDIYEDYVFVRKFSGHGWDDTENHATATEQHIADFILEYGKQYNRCFKKPCPFYDRLDELYDGGKNRATGEAILHLGAPNPKAKMSKAANDSESGNDVKKILSRKTSKSRPTDASEKENIPAVRGVERGQVGEGDAELPIVLDLDDDLAVTPVKPRRGEKRARADSDDDATESTTRAHRRRSSKSDSGKRNADAGFALANGLENLSEAVKQPIKTAEDISHVDDVVKVLEADATLLPPDPLGDLYDKVLEKLTDTPIAARRFIQTSDPLRRRAAIRRILIEAGFDIPADF
ncbi:hypothetical protein GGX14DRAFT_609652 [Mycena pura]|uniref:Myb/SANT-like domain-containing protein n=1 Tax=Mycena pura TaxID=153505 RepID=A0AAD6YD83_9AGAR|nr:hypothetical protein GGX14DRAFT_609652 [Mycena pura]